MASPQDIEPKGRTETLRTKLGTPAFAQMDTLFSEVHKPRGGHIRDMIPQLPETPDELHVPGYHVEMTWTPDQLEYVEVAFGYLADLAKGHAVVQRELGPTKVQTDTLAQRIERQFSQTATQPGEIHYGHVLTDAVVELLQVFGEYYPTWTPVMAAAFTIAGGEGTKIAINESVHFLINALQGTLNADNVHTYLNHLVFRHDRFGTEHPGLGYQPQEYELWCSGESVAKIIMDSARVAAVQIAQLPDIRARYNPDWDEGISGYVHAQSQKTTTQQVMASRDWARTQAGFELPE